MSLFPCRCTVERDSFLFCHSSSHIKHECFIWNAACFHFPPHCHGDSPSKSSPIEIPVRIWCNCHTAGLSCLSPSFNWEEKILLDNHKMLTYKTCSWENVRKVKRVRVIWLSCHGNCINPSSVFRLFYRKGRRGWLRLEPTSGPTVYHHELRCIKTTFMFKWYQCV